MHRIEDDDVGLAALLSMHGRREKSLLEPSLLEESSEELPLRDERRDEQATSGGEHGIRVEESTDREDAERSLPATPRGRSLRARA